MITIYCHILQCCVAFPFHKSYFLRHHRLQHAKYTIYSYPRTTVHYDIHTPCGEQRSNTSLLGGAASFQYYFFFIRNQAILVVSLHTCTTTPCAPLPVPPPLEQRAPHRQPRRRRRQIFPTFIMAELLHGPYFSPRPPLRRPGGCMRCSEILFFISDPPAECGAERLSRDSCLHRREILAPSSFVLAPCSFLLLLAVLLSLIFNPRCNGGATVLSSRLLPPRRLFLLLSFTSPAGDLFSSPLLHLLFPSPSHPFHGFLLLSTSSLSPSYSTLCPI